VSLRPTVDVRRIGPNRWMLLADAVRAGARQAFRARAGFITDFATIPWWSAWITPRTGLVDIPALFHDQHCRQLHAGECAISSRDVDGLFRRMLREEGMGARRWLYWAGVRWGALASPARRRGWWRDAPVLLAVTAAALAAAVVCAAGVGLVAAALLRLL
jgi:hypothetical protein